jgi:citronellol/citronellal dehydrogenase
MESQTDGAPTAGVLRPDVNAGKVALVTGGGTGIGRACATALAASGARVAIAGRREDLLGRVREEIAAAGGECIALPCDIREPDRVEELVADVLDRWGSIDVLVANAGGQFESPAEEINGKGWRAVERLNLDGNWDLTSRVARESMIPGDGGLIVYVGFSPRRGIPGFAHACATRAALENLASTLSLEWSRYGIRSVCRPIETEGLASYGPDSLEESRRTVPLGRLGRPEEVGDVVAFLASPGGGFITGTTILVDGGVDAWGMAEPPPAPKG